MSKLNASRIVNLTYNNASANAINKIIDETFELGGEHTLNLLRNGGGKTVQIQMMMSPFVSPRFRNLGSRNFEDYFSDEKNPTYIATEWLLENGDKVLIGLVVKKSSSIGDDDNSKGLDIMSYVYEYKNESDEYSIRNMPFSKNTDTGYTVMSMSEAESLFKTLKNKNKFTFDYFNLNVDSNRTRYYKKLRSYSIEPTEWESIMRAINQDEGGLSKLFSDAKTEEALIESWFLKNVHLKLNKDNEVVKEMGKSIKQYINNKRSKQNLIDTLYGIEGYKGYTENILNVNEVYKEALDKKKKKQGEIEDVMVYNYQSYRDLNSKLNDTNDQKDELDKSIAMTKYEKESYKYHKAISDMNSANNLLLDETAELENLKKQLKDLERDEQVQEVINLNNQKQEKVKDLELVRAKRDKELQSNEEIQRQLADVAITLKDVLDNEKSLNEDKIKSYIDKDEELNKKKQESDKALIELKTEEGILKSEIERYESTILASYNQLLKVMQDKYDLPLLVDGDFIEDLMSSVSDKLKSKESECLSKNKEIEDLNKEVDNIKDDINSKSIKTINLANELKTLNTNLDKANKRCEEMVEVLEYINVEDKSKIFDIPYMTFKVNDIIKHVNDKIDYDVNERSKKMTQLDMLNKGVVVEVPLDVKAKLEELGVDYDLGLNYLNNLKISDVQKEELLTTNPYLPFSIVLEDSDIKMLENTDLDISSSYNVYVANRDKLSEKIEVSVSNSVYRIDNLTMLFNFNKTLLDESKRQEQLDVIEHEISALTRGINENREYLKLINGCAHKIESFDITESYIKGLEDNIESLNKEIEELNISIETSKKKQYEILNQSIPKLREALKSSEVDLNNIKMELSEIESFYKSYSEFEKESEIVDKKKSKIETIKQEISTIVLSLEEIDSAKKLNEASLRKTKDILKEVDDKILEINDLNLNLDNAKKINLEKNKLEAQFKALKMKSSSSLEELEDRLKAISKEVSRIENDMESIIDSYSIAKSEYEGQVYLIEVKNQIRTLRKSKEKAIEAQQKAVIKATVGLEKAKDIVDKRHKSCNKASEEAKMVYINTGSFIDFKEGILELSDIKTADFKEKEDSLNAELSIVEGEISNLESMIDDIKASNQKLDFLSYIRDAIEDISSREVVLDINSTSELNDLTSTLIKEYKERESEIESSKKNIDEAFALLTTEFKYKDIPPFSKNIQSLLEVRYEPVTVAKSIESTLELLDRLQKQNEADLQVVNEERENISKTLLKYVEQTYTHLGMIDRNSRIDIDGENKKMLEIKQPEWDIVLYNTKIEEFVENVTAHCEKRLNLGEPIDEYIASQVTTSRLYDFVVGISNTHINLRKLESLNNKIATSKVKWKDVVKNSGGEGFVSAFVILVSLLSYMRRDNETIGDKKEEGKVLIMDNPFGKMSSEHLIKPVMMIADKYNTQLICYTAQKGDNIYNRFPNIYHMETEYIAGAKMNVLTSSRQNEYKETHLNGSRFLVGEQQSMEDLFNIED